jgi:hypothetical protein
MPELDKLRAQLTPVQQAIINTIWLYDREKNQGIPCLTLYDLFGSEEAVWSALEPLGGDIAYIPKYDGGKRRFHLTFLGRLLAEQGEELEELLVRYLEYVQKQLKIDGELNKIDLQEAMTAIGFSPEQKDFFKNMLYRTPYHGGGGGDETGLPPDVDEWYFAPDMHAYVQQRALRRYDPATPIDGGRPIYIQVASPYVFENIHMPESTPLEISESLERFRKDHPDPSKVAFVMMRFGQTPAHNNIVAGIQAALASSDIVSVRADEKEYHEDLFQNIQTYIYGCAFGVAVFERLEEENFNPNVSLEVGYMMALKKPICLLKDRTLKTLHTDLIGKLYRVFDPQDPSGSISVELSKWLKDKGFSE